MQIIRDLCSRCVSTRLLYSELRFSDKRIHGLMFEVTPEKLTTSDFMKILDETYSRHELKRLVVDEAHCISVRIIS